MLEERFVLHVTMGTWWRAIECEGNTIQKLVNWQHEWVEREVHSDRSIKNISSMFWFNIRAWLSVILWCLVLFSQVGHAFILEDWSPPDEQPNLLWQGLVLWGKEMLGLEKLYFCVKLQESWRGNVWLRKPVRLGILWWDCNYGGGCLVLGSLLENPS